MSHELVLFQEAYLQKFSEEDKEDSTEDGDFETALAELNDISGETEDPVRLVEPAPDFIIKQRPLLQPAHRCLQRQRVRSPAEIDTAHVE